MRISFFIPVHLISAIIPWVLTQLANETLSRSPVASYHLPLAGKWGQALSQSSLTHACVSWNLFFFWFWMFFSNSFFFIIIIYLTFTEFCSWWKFVSCHFQTLTYLICFPVFDLKPFDVGGCISAYCFCRPCSHGGCACGIPRWWEDGIFWCVLGVFLVWFSCVEKQ